MSKRIVVVGESIVDVIDRAGERSLSPGGSPLNVAIGTARLGIPSTFITQFGNDHYGALLSQHLATAGVTVDLCESASTSTAVAHIGPDGSAAYEFDVQWNPGTLGTINAEILHTGSIGCWMEPGAEAVATAFADRVPNRLTSIDANIRPALITDQRRTIGRIESLFSVAEIVKLSDEDAEWLYPDLEVHHVLDHLLELGAKIAIMTRGSAGADLTSATARVHIDVPAVAVVDTIGAGDSFMSGVLAHILECDDRSLVASGTISESRLAAMGHFAARCAAITVTRHGANPPTRAELNRNP